MSELTWGAHIAWCKSRAKAYLPNDPEQAIASMASDLRKYEGEGAPGSEVIAALVMSAFLGPRDERMVRKWIDGWN